MHVFAEPLPQRSLMRQTATLGIEIAVPTRRQLRDQIRRAFAQGEGEQGLVGTIDPPVRIDALYQRLLEMRELVQDKRYHILCPFGEALGGDEDAHGTRQAGGPVMFRRHAGDQMLHPFGRLPKKTSSSPV
ncbi:MAG: hypothetical protein ACREMD_00375 [Gemmatimonadota bacterium]